MFCVLRKSCTNLICKRVVSVSGRLHSYVWKGPEGMCVWRPLWTAQFSLCVQTQLFCSRFALFQQQMPSPSLRSIVGSPDSAPMDQCVIHTRLCALEVGAALPSPGDPQHSLDCLSPNRRGSVTSFTLDGVVTKRAVLLACCGSDPSLRTVCIWPLVKHVIWFCLSLLFHRVVLASSWR